MSEDLRFKQWRCCKGHEYNEKDCKEKYYDQLICPFCWPKGFGVTDETINEPIAY